MAWGFISKLPISAEQYDQLNAEIGSDDPAGLILHTASAADGGKLRIIDIWESEDAYRRFEKERLMPAAERLGWPAPTDPPQPIEFAVHNMRGSAA